MKSRDTEYTMSSSVKVDVSRIIDMRPKSDSSADIATALQAAREEHGRTMALHAEMKAQRGALLVRGSVAAVEAHDQALQCLESFISDLIAFLDDLGPELPAAQMRERVGQLEASIAALDRVGKVARFKAKFDAEYERAARAIAEIMALEVEAATATERERVYLSQLHALGQGGVPNVPNAYTAVTGGSLMTYTSFGAMVRLPGVLGAPYIPVEVSRSEIVTQSEVADWDRLSEGKTSTGLPRATKMQEVVSEEIKVGPVRKDAPIWWPAARLQSLR